MLAELVLAQRMTVRRQVDAVVSPLLERVDRIAARVIRLDAGARRRLAFRSGEARQRTIVRMSNRTPIDQAGTRADDDGRPGTRGVSFRTNASPTHSIWPHPDV